MAERDIAPELIEKVNKEFDQNLSMDKRASDLKEKLDAGKANYKDAYEYAESVGKARAKAFGSEISSEVLPDGKMYYNIASRLMEDTLSADHELVADFAAAVQRAYNLGAGIHLKEQRADLDEDRIKGFVDRLSSEENFDDVAWILGEPIVTYARSVVDDTVKKNAEFQHKAGIKATINRKAAARCCDWCTDLEGDYTYPGVPREVFQRHDHCRCVLDYNGKRLTAYESKNGAHSFRDSGENGRIDKTSSIGNRKNREDYIKKYNSIQAAQSEGDSKKPLSMIGDFEDFKPLELSDDDKKALKELNMLAQQTDWEYGYATYKGGETDFHTDKQHGDVKITYPQGSEGIRLFHCHTDESVPSGVDLSALINPNVEKTHIISINGDVWTASVGSGIRPSKDEFDDIMGMCYTEAKDAIKEHPDFNSWSYEERYYMLMRERMLRIGRYFEWDIAGGRL